MQFDEGLHKIKICRPLTKSQSYYASRHIFPGHFTQNDTEKMCFNMIIVLFMIDFASIKKCDKMKPFYNTDK